ncbi:MAG: PEGA domain-containing protein [Bacteroidetes bacterium]|nr:PEGA domain-containing protein [Bacteroidota bacterium]MCW5896836.1 PEGA domain-containing protein [Bacteroidota bacterium]
MNSFSVLFLILLIAMHARAESPFAAPDDTTRGYCSLSITSSPPGAEVLLNGKIFGVTPIVCGDLPLGKHILRLRLEGFLDHTDTLTFDSAKVFVRDIQLIEPGTLTITSDPPEADVIIDGSNIGKTPIAGLRMKPGIILLRVTKVHHTPFEQSVVIQQDKEANIAVQLLRRQGSLTVHVTPSNADVFVDGKNIGKGSIENYELEAGRYLISVEEGGHKLQHNIFVPPGSRVEVQATVNQYSLAAFRTSLLAPGLGQFMDGAAAKGIAMMGAFAGSTSFLIASLSDYSTKQENYTLLRQAYRSANTEADALAAGTKALAAHQDMESSFKKRRTAIVLIGVVYAAIVLDAYLHHTRVGSFEAVPQKLFSSLHPVLSADGHSMSVGIQLNF